MTQAADSDTTNVVRLPTAALYPPPRPRMNSKARRVAIYRRDMLDLEPLILARKHAAERAAALAAMEMIWVRVPAGAWRDLTKCVRDFE